MTDIDGPWTTATRGRRQQQAPNSSGQSPKLAHPAHGRRGGSRNGPRSRGTSYTSAAKEPYYAIPFSTDIANRMVDLVVPIGVQFTRPTAAGSGARIETTTAEGDLEDIKEESNEDAPSPSKAAVSLTPNSAPALAAQQGRATTAPTENSGNTLLEMASEGQPPTAQAAAPKKAATAREIPAPNWTNEMANAINVISAKVADHIAVHTKVHPGTFSGKLLEPQENGGTITACFSVGFKQLAPLRLLMTTPLEIDGKTHYWQDASGRITLPLVFQTPSVYVTTDDLIPALGRLGEIQELMPIYGNHNIFFGVWRVVVALKPGAKVPCSLRIHDPGFKRTTPVGLYVNAHPRHCHMHFGSLYDECPGEKCYPERTTAVPVEKATERAATNTAAATASKIKEDNEREEQYGEADANKGYSPSDEEIIPAEQECERVIALKLATAAATAKAEAAETAAAAAAMAAETAAAAIAFKEATATVVAAKRNEMMYNTILHGIADQDADTQENATQRANKQRIAATILSEESLASLLTDKGKAARNALRLLARQKTANTKTTEPKDAATRTTTPGKKAAGARTKAPTTTSPIDKVAGSNSTAKTGKKHPTGCTK
ncbi:hypothetical protein IW140_001839 [Coemansia sp. RSA 1813]|nr:hypothetical protein LPJ74_001511 [Coemansia sp. RSA 1843]KAJ2213605.1 hypothetical protein EV179_003720 [Coemansia sp. RSA 487]KAJ2571137.1 hypothetical protein IW140_001839 [Coemansia sp. RSA 1813]